MKRKRMRSMVLLSALLASVTVMSMSCTSPKVPDQKYPESQDGQEESTSADVISEGETDVLLTDNDGFLLDGFDPENELPNGLEGMASPESQGVYTWFSTSVNEALAGKQITALGSVFTYQDSDRYWKTTSEEEFGTFYSSYDEYRSEDGASVRYLSDSDRMTLYLSGDLSHIDSAPSPLTFEQARVVADEFLRSILPETILDHIPWYTTSDSTISSAISVVYNRSIHGYLTDEDIVVAVDTRTGQIRGYNGQCVGKYAELEKHLTKELLDETAAKLEAKVVSLGLRELEMRQPVLTTNTDGEVYMSLTFDYDSDFYGGTDTLRLLCKVEIPAA